MLWSICTSIQSDRGWIVNAPPVMTPFVYLDPVFVPRVSTMDLVQDAVVIGVFSFWFLRRCALLPSMYVQRLLRRNFVLCTWVTELHQPVR